MEKMILVPVEELVKLRDAQTRVFVSQGKPPTVQMLLDCSAQVTARIPTQNR